MNPNEIADFLVMIMLGALGLIIASVIVISITQHLFKRYWPKWLCEKFDWHPEPLMTFKSPTQEVARCKACQKVIYRDEIMSKWMIHEDQTTIL